MVYSNRFVACVLVNGQPQKELANGTVLLPFGQEYSLRFRNKHNRRALVKFTIDNENVSGNGYVIAANGSTDIHRHRDKDARFKFVSLDSPDAVEFGKNGPNTDGSKGVIEAKFFLEKEAPVFLPVEHHHHHHHYPRPYYQPYWGNTWPYKGSGISGSILRTSSSSVSTSSNLANFGATAQNQSSPTVANFGATAQNQSSPIQPTVSITERDLSFVEPTIKDGCTVEGSQSGQTINLIPFSPENDYVTVRIVLRWSESLHATAPVENVSSESVFPDVSFLTYCTNCGAKKGRDSDKFCGQCGRRV
jgi:hypothetical protein